MSPSLRPVSAERPDGSTHDDNILQRRLWINREPLRNSPNSIGSEGTLRIDIGDLSLTSSELNRELSRDAERVAQLRLAATELAVHCSFISTAQRKQGNIPSVMDWVWIPPPSMASKEVEPVVRLRTFSR